MKKGQAELFGKELLNERKYDFMNMNGSIFTWYGCTLSVIGTQLAHEKCYISTETPMVSYLSTHAAIEYRREEAVRSQNDGPRVQLCLK